MKKTYVTLAVLFSIIGILLLNWSSVHGLLVARPNFAALHVEPVVLYGTSWCGNCKLTRAYLRKNKIPFFEYDVEQSPEGQRQFKVLQGNGVPLLLVKNNVLRGFNPDAIHRAMQN